MPVLPVCLADNVRAVLTAAAANREQLSGFFALHVGEQQQEAAEADGLVLQRVSENDGGPRGPQGRGFLVAPHVLLHQGGRHLCTARNANASEEQLGCRAKRQGTFEIGAKGLEDIWGLRAAGAGAEAVADSKSCHSCFSECLRSSNCPLQRCGNRQLQRQHVQLHEQLLLQQQLERAELDVVVARLPRCVSGALPLFFDV